MARNRNLGALALIVVCACGGGDESHPTQQSMVPTRARARSQEGNRAPVVSSVLLDPPQPVPGKAVETRVEASDPDGNPGRRGYRWTVNGRPLAVTTSSLPAGSAGREDRIEVAVTATDGFLESDEVRAHAALQPSAPVVNGVSFDPPEGLKPGVPVAALVDAGADNDAALRLEYRWLVNGEETDEHERSFDTTKLRRGDKLQVEGV